MTPLPEIEAWPEGTRRELLVNQTVLASGALGCAWLLLDGWWSLALGVVGVGIPLAKGLLGGTPQLVATSDALEQHGRRPQRLLFADINKVETSANPFRDPVLEFVTPRGSIECRLDDSTRPFIRCVGELLLPHRRHIHASASVVGALGWPRWHGQPD